MAKPLIPHRTTRPKRKLTVAQTQVVLLNKPFNVLCQFSPDGSHRTLKDLIQLPQVYPAGRLDLDSEGLLILTNNGELQHRLANPKFKFPKRYLVQVEGAPSDADLNPLRQGVTLKDGKTLPISAEIIADPNLWQRDPPIRQRQNIPTTWLALTLKEGRNRQVRRMTAHIGYPTLRLVREKIGTLSIKNLAPGEWRLLTDSEKQRLFEALKLK